MSAANHAHRPAHGGFPAAAPMPGDTYEQPKHGWTCFHCGETFTTVGSARDHFGYTQYADPGCIIDKVAVEEGGKPERGRGLLMALRQAEAELARYRQEDTDLHREIHRLQSEHGQALRREEEKGYARGLRDGVNLPADSPERASLAQAAIAVDMPEFEHAIKPTQPWPRR